MKLRWINLSFSYLIHACVEEAILGFWKRWLSWERGLFLLRVVRGAGYVSLWRLINGDVDG